MPFKSQSISDLKLPTRATSTREKRGARLSTLPPAGVILGIDPGLHRTGFGILAILNDEERRGGRTAHHLREAGVLQARADAPLPIRLETLFDGLCDLLKKHQPDVMVVEELFSTYAHPRSALLMAQARGVLLLAAAQAGVAVHSFLPNEVKQVVAGDGHASKPAMQNAVKVRLNLKQIPEPHDAADALAIALCFALRQNVHTR